MSQHYAYLTFPPSPGTALGTTPFTFGSLQQITALYDNGVFHNAFGDISGSDYLTNGLTAGGVDSADSLDITTNDIHNILIWDEDTTSQKNGLTNPDGSPQYSNPFDLYGGGRYGMTGDGTNQAVAIDIIQVGQGAAHNGDSNLINLSYSNSTAGGAAHAFNTSVTIIGGPGRDLIIGGEAGDLIYGGDEHSALGDGIWGGGGGDTIYGGSDFGTVGGAADDLFGYSGDDIIYGGTNGDVYYGDAGSDVIYGATSGGSILVNPNSGGANIAGTNVTFFGGDGNDTMYASTGGTDSTPTKEFFFGGTPYFDPAGTTTIGTPGGTPVVVGDGWVDHVFDQTTNTMANVDNGNMDVVSYANGPAGITVDLTGGTYFGATGATYTHDTTYVVTVAGNNYTLANQPIDDGTAIGTGAGGAAGDVFYGIEGIIGTALADTLIGDAHNNLFYGGDGNDFMSGGAGADSFVGGNGTDLVDYSHSAVGITMGLNGVAGTGGEALGDVAALDIENLNGGSGDDVLTGNVLSNIIHGNDGNDVIFGGNAGGNDTFDGGNGSDIIAVNFLNTTQFASLIGGANSGSDGADTIFTSGSYDHVNSDLGLGNDLFIGSAAQVSTLTGGDIDIVNGQDGNDAIAGWLGNDTVYGGNDADALWGGAGADVIYGGAGDDYIYPGTGTIDNMYGGTGDDGYWVSRTDGSNNQIWDEERNHASTDRTMALNYLVIIPETDQATGNFIAGTGVFETDHDIMNATGMVQLTQGNPTGRPDVWTLNVISGDGAGNTSVVFDDRDITQIVLWNSDATGGAPTLQIYQWDEASHTYVFQP